LIKVKKNDTLIPITKARSFHLDFDFGRTRLLIARVRFVSGKFLKQKGMAICVCLGEQCVCEAIQVPPKLSFWKKHDRPVHGFIAWVAIINMALIAWLPIAMYAQEPDHVSDAVSPTVVSGVDTCVRQCEAEKNQCALNAAANTQEERSEKCEERAKKCYERCTIAPELGLPSKEGKELKREAKKERKTESASSSSEREAEKRELHKKLLVAKKRISEFSRNLLSMKRKIAQLEKKGMTPPEGLKEALANGEKIVAALKSADSTEELDDIQEKMEKAAETLKDGLSALEKQRKAPQKFTVLEKQLRQFDHQIATAKKVSGDDVEMMARLATAEEALTELKDVYRQAHDLIVAGDVDGGFALLEGTVPGLVKSYKEALKEVYAARP
jgi:hypothetical protein